MGSGLEIGASTIHTPNVLIIDLTVNCHLWTWSLLIQGQLSSPGSTNRTLPLPLHIYILPRLRFPLLPLNQDSFIHLTLSACCPGPSNFSSHTGSSEISGWHSAPIPLLLRKFIHLSTLTFCSKPSVGVVSCFVQVNEPIRVSIMRVSQIFDISKGMNIWRWFCSRYRSGHILTMQESSYMGNIVLLSTWFKLKSC